MNNPFKYTDPSGYLWQGPVEPDAPTFTRGGMSYNDDYNRMILHPFGNMIFDAFGAFDKVYNSSLKQIGFSKSAGPSYEVWNLLNWVRTFINADNAIIRKFVSFSFAPSPTLYVLTRRMLSNSEGTRFFQ